MKTINLGRGEGEVVIRPSLHNLFGWIALMTKYCQKVNPFGFICFLRHLKNGGV